MTDDPTALDLARLLHQLRRREARRRGGAELPYRELAARTGWSLGIIAQYFSGKTLPPVDRLDALVRLLGASPAEQGALATMRDNVDELRRGRLQPAVAAFRLLGPVKVIGPDGVARLVGVRQRVLVGLLALNANRIVTQARLVDALWGDEPPRTAVQSLYSHVARVRQALDSCGLRGVLRTDGAGYVLAVRFHQVDAGQFEARLGQARKALADGAVADAVTQLREALSLWRGDAFTDAPAHAWGAAEVDRLHEARLAAHEDLWDARLRLGDHVGVPGEIEKLLISHPGRERLVGLLMQALYQEGRPAAALDAFQRLRAHLAESLGVEPCPQVQRLHTAILRRDAELDPVRPAAGPPRPAQLPRRIGHFTGRSMELAILDGLPTDGRKVAVVSGPAGMGKTALAVHWAVDAADRYPDGQLFLDLRGHDPASAMPVGEALTQLLAGLGVPPAQIPADPAMRVGLYRSVLHRRRVLVLLDNASALDQVAALVPPPPSQLLVTSRDRLTGLAVDHVVTVVDLEILPPLDALALLGRVLGTDRVTRETAAATRLVELCGRMPLALRIAAAKLIARPKDRISSLVTELAGADRLDALSVPGDSRSIRTVFAGAYQALSPSAARLFRRLSLHPGPSFTAGLASALVQEPVQAPLDQLVAAHLVATADAGRYRFHDLIGVYARERAESEEAQKAATRIIDWYLTISDAANQAIDPSRDRVEPVTVVPPIEPPFGANRDEALAYLDTERNNLLPVMRLAAGRGDDRAVWQLTYLLTSYHKLRGYWSAQVEFCELGLASARRLADPAVEAQMRAPLGAALVAIQRYDDALEHLTVAHALMRDVGDRRGQGMVLNNIALAYTESGRFDAALETFRRSVVLHEANGHRPGIATALNNIGHTYLQMGRYEPARRYLRQALELTRELGLAGHEAFALQSLGEVDLAEADPDAALGHFDAALAIRRRLGERRLEAGTLAVIGLAHRCRGDSPAAVAHFRQVIVLARELGDRELEAVTAERLKVSGAQDRHDRDPVGNLPR